MQNQPNHPSEKNEIQWDILNILRWTANYFQSHNIENPRASAEILLAHALNLERIDLYIRYDQPLCKDELAIFRGLIKRRVKNEPVAYIVGHKEFWSLDFLVTEDVLIPRPETESLVEAILPLLPSINSNFQNKKEASKRILDMGTGSGAIILALASERPGHLFFASDRSEKAVQVARENAKRHHLEESVSFLCGNWFEPFKTGQNQFDIIVSNPPYIRTADIKGLQPEISRYEPVTALDGGNDGLSAVRDIILAAPHYLAKGGYLLLEIGYDQKDDVNKIAGSCNDYEDILFIKDYSAHDRVVRMRKKQD